MERTKQKSYIDSKEKANKTLVFVIRVLKGEIVTQSWKGRLELALIMKERLLECGYTWQARRIDNWIHRLQPRRSYVLQPRGADLSIEREREGGS